MPANLLLIDDNAVQAATRQTILKRAGYLVIPVLNPLRALEQLETKSFCTEVDLVLTDHLMPEMTGTEFVKRLRRLYPEMPVLVISGLEEAESEYQGLNVQFRRKPLPPHDLLATVAAMLEKHTLVADADPA